MTGYTKLFSTILDSTVWSEPLSTRVVWIAMLAMADRDGVVWARAPGIAKRAGVTREECDRALATFSSPDPDSRTPDHDGRRATETTDGWLILNYEVYRDRASAAEKAEKNAARQARWRARQKAKADHDVTPRNAPLRDVTRVTHSAASASAAAEALRPSPVVTDDPPPPEPDLVYLNRRASEAGWMGSVFASDRTKQSAHRVIELAKETARAKGAPTWRKAFDKVFAAWLTEKPSRINLRNWPSRLAEDWHQMINAVEAQAAQ